MICSSSKEPRFSSSIGGAGSGGGITEIRSTMKTKSLLATMISLRACSPYALALGICNTRRPPAFMPAIPSSQPTMTRPAPSGNENGASSGSHELSNSVPSAPSTPTYSISTVAPATASRPLPSIMSVTINSSIGPRNSSLTSGFTSGGNTTSSRSSSSDPSSSASEWAQSRTCTGTAAPGAGSAASSSPTASVPSAPSSASSVSEPSAVSAGSASTASLDGASAVSVLAVSSLPPHEAASKANRTTMVSFFTPRG